MISKFSKLLFIACFSILAISLSSCGEAGSEKKEADPTTVGPATTDSTTMDSADTRPPVKAGN